MSGRNFYQILLSSVFNVPILWFFLQLPLNPTLRQNTTDVVSTWRVYLVWDRASLMFTKWAHSVQSCLSGIIVNHGNTWHRVTPCPRPFFFHHGIVSCHRIDPVIDSVKSRAPATCHSSAPAALLFNCRLRRWFFLLPLKSLIDFYTTLHPCCSPF